jgi:hypothetical protein
MSAVGWTVGADGEATGDESGSVDVGRGGIDVAAVRLAAIVVAEAGGRAEMAADPQPTTTSGEQGADRDPLHDSTLRRACRFAGQ